jgi:hypothetical protein
LREATSLTPLRESLKGVREVAFLEVVREVASLKGVREVASLKGVREVASLEGVTQFLLFRHSEVQLLVLFLLY